MLVFLFCLLYSEISASKSADNELGMGKQPKYYKETGTGTGQVPKNWTRKGKYNRTCPGTVRKSYLDLKPYTELPNNLSQL